MDRLTDRSNNQNDRRLSCMNRCYNAGDCINCDSLENAVDRLAAYEDAEEQGLLVQFPKKVYTLDTTPLVKGVVEWEVMCGEYNVRDKLLTRLDVLHKGFGDYTASVLSIYRGNKWYLTHEEAEAALAKEG